MAIAALVISIVSAVAAIGAVVFTRQQAKSAGETLTLERARRLDEQRPKFEATITEFNGGGWYRLDLTLSTSWPLTGIEVTIVEGEGVRFGRGQNGVRPTGVDDPMKSAEWEALRPGGLACWKVDLDSDRSNSIRLEVTCHGEHGEQWLVPVRVDVPRYPAEYFKAYGR